MKKYNEKKRKKQQNANNNPFTWLFDSHQIEMVFVRKLLRHQSENCMCLLQIEYKKKVTLTIIKTRWTDVFEFVFMFHSIVTRIRQITKVLRLQTHLNIKLHTVNNVSAFSSFYESQYDWIYTIKPHQLNNWLAIAISC